MNNIFVPVIINNIYYYLSIEDLYNCSTVNKTFNRVFKNVKLWENLFQRRYSENIYNIVKDAYKTDNYRILFKKCSDLERCVKTARFGRFSEKIVGFDEKIVKTLLNVTKCDFLREKPLGFDSLLKLCSVDIVGQTVDNTTMEKIGRIRSLTSIGMMNITTNNIKEISNLKNLRNLILKNCNIGDKYDIKKLPHLESLHLIDNSVCDFSQIRDLPKLIVLGISNKIINIPLNIFKFHNLVILKLSNNKFNCVPPEIKNLTKLKNLDLSHNDFNVFPIEICSLTTLSRLSLSHNKIEVVPNEINVLRELSRFDISYNRLTSFTQLNNMIKISPSILIHSTGNTQN